MMTVIENAKQVAPALNDIMVGLMRITIFDKSHTH